MIHPMKFFTTHAVVKRISSPKIQTCWDSNPDLCDKTAVQHSNQCMSDIVGAVHAWCTEEPVPGYWYKMVPDMLLCTYLFLPFLSLAESVQDSGLPQN